jgi:Concanavalin A-like lectin/glucanases superfamily
MPSQPRDASAADVRVDAPAASDQITTADSRPADRSSPPDAAGDSVAAALPRLVGYWKFDEAAGASNAVDSSGNGNHGVLQAVDTSSARVAGHQGSAVEFTVAGDPGAGVEVPLSSSLAAIRHFTLGAWIYLPQLTTSTSCVVSSQLGNEVAEVFNLAVKNAELVIWVGTDVEMYPSVKAPVLVPDSWMHVAATFDGADLRLYKNGLEVGSRAAARELPGATNPFYIGTNKNPAYNEVFEGLIDEVVLYSVALPADAIARLHSGAAPAGL